MNIQSKNTDKKSSKGGIITAVILILLSIVNSFDGGGAAAFIIVIVALIIIIGFAGKKNKKKDASAPVCKPEKNTVSHETSTADTTVRKYYDSDCQKMSSEHDHNRRMEQLDGFLENGVIDKAEYDILKLKYMR